MHFASNQYNGWFCPSNTRTVILSYQAVVHLILGHKKKKRIPIIFYHMICGEKDFGGGKKFHIETLKMMFYFEK